MENGEWEPDPIDAECNIDNGEIPKPLDDILANRTSIGITWTDSDFTFCRGNQ